MKIATTIRGLLAVLALQSVTFCTYGQHALTEVELTTQIEKSSKIIEGEVLDQESFWDSNHQNIYTKHTLQVFKVFKGASSETIQLITQGGVVGLEAEVVSTSLQLRKGDLGVFMLKSNVHKSIESSSSGESFNPVSASQGFYKYDLLNNKAANRFRNFDDIESSLYQELQSNLQSEYKDVKYFRVKEEVHRRSKSLNRSTSEASISSFSATSNSAGTGSVLTINGSGFGSTTGAVGFSDANYGGAIYYDALDSQILSWTDNKIQVEIPDRAGTGEIKVTSAENSAVESSSKLNIDFAQINIDYSDRAFQTQHINNNNDGGNTWIMNQGFSTSEAKDAFVRAFESWTCNTGVNWTIDSETTTISKRLSDGVNIITFDDSLPSGVLGSCSSRYSGCTEGGEVKWYVKELDIVFNSSKPWNFSAGNPSSGQIDFESVAVHELGHGHQLGHVIDSNVTMHYALSVGEMQRGLSPEDLVGAKDVQNRSSSSTVCGELSMTDYSCSSLGIDDEELLNDFVIYPNPAKNNFYIKNNSSITIDQVTIYNIEGRQISSLELTNSNRLSPISIQGFSPGLYFINMKSDLGVLTKKLMIK